MVIPSHRDFDHELRPRRERARAARVLTLFVAAVVTSCSSTPPRPDPEVPAEEAPVSREAKEFVYRDQRPISDTHPYQINDYLIYPVKTQKVEDVAPVIQQLFQARFGSGLVVIPHIPTNKLLIYLPPPHERERAGAAGAGARSLRTPATRGRSTRGTATRAVTPTAR